MSDLKLFILALVFVLASALKLMHPELSSEMRAAAEAVLEQKGNYVKIIETAGETFSSRNFKADFVEALKKENSRELQVIKLGED